jgi:hypothetical protein
MLLARSGVSDRARAWPDAESELGPVTAPLKAEHRWLASPRHATVGRQTRRLRQAAIHCVRELAAKPDSGAAGSCSWPPDFEYDFPVCRVKLEVGCSDGALGRA